MAKLSIAIIFGGKSSEHDVSISSAATIANNISDKYDVHYFLLLYQLNYTKSIVIINKFMLDKLYKLLYYVDYKKGGMRIARIRVSL